MPDEMVPLSSAIRVHYGAALKAEARVQGGPYAVYGSSGEVGKHDKVLFHEPTIIIGRKGSVGAVTFAPSGGWAIDTAFYIEVLEPAKHSLRYLFYALSSANLKQHAITTSIPGLSRDDIYRTVVPLPPLPEQRRIADILDKADAIRKKRKQAIALTEQLLRSAFVEMFGDPVTNPKGWPVRPLGEVIKRFDAGWSANGDSRQRLANEFAVLKISAVTSGYFRPEECKVVDQASITRELVTPEKGDLLFSRANTRELVAATCLIEDDHPNLFLPDKLWRLVPNVLAATPFLRFLLSHEGQRLELTKTATGTSGSMLNISMEKLGALSVPIPPRTTQDRFSDLVWGALSAVKVQTSALAASDTLFDSLVHRAFRGEL